VIRKVQALELVGILATSPYPVVLVGDLNSHRDFAGDSWQILSAAGYTDVWTETMPGVAGYTASFGDDLIGPPSELDHTVDNVMRSTGRSLDGVDGLGEVLGDELEDRTPTGLWPSDHAGVSVTVRIERPSGDPRRAPARRQPRARLGAAITSFHLRAVTLGAYCPPVQTPSRPRRPRVTGGLERGERRDLIPRPHANRSPLRRLFRVSRHRRVRVPARGGDRGSRNPRLLQGDERGVLRR